MGDIAQAQSVGCTEQTAESLDCIWKEKDTGSNWIAGGGR